MARTISFVLILAIYCLPVFGQCPSSLVTTLVAEQSVSSTTIDGETIIVPESEFPFGFMQFHIPYGGYAKDKFLRIWKDLKFNAFYCYHTGNSFDKDLHKFSTGENATAPDVERVAYPRTDEFDDIYGKVYTASMIDASETRYFLATNDVKGLDYETNWSWHNTSNDNDENTQKGGLDVLNGNPDEWFIGAAQKDAGGFHLRGLQAYQNTLSAAFYICTTPSDEDADGKTKTGYVVAFKKGQTNKIICDFIFRIDEDAYSSVPPTANIYKLEYSVNTGGSWSIPAGVGTVMITPKYYSEYVHHSSNPDIVVPSGPGITSEADFIATEHHNIKRFPLYEGNEKEFKIEPETNSKIKDYCVIRTVLTIPVNNEGDPLWQTIDCTLKPEEDAQGIFVRGVRFRSLGADKLLRGKDDASILAKFAQIKRNLEGYCLKKSSVTPAEMDLDNGNIKPCSSTTQTNCNQFGEINIWNKTPYVLSGGEIMLPGWRAYAYIDNLWKEWSGGKRIVPLLNDNNNVEGYPWWRAVYEDQTGQIPPPLMPECDDIYNLYSNQITEDECYPAEAYITAGYPKDMVSNKRIDDAIEGTTTFSLFGYPVQGYDVYTLRSQQRLDMCTDKRLRETLAANPPHRAKSIWWGNIWAEGNVQGREWPNIRGGNELGTLDSDTGEPEDATSIRGKLYDFLKNSTHPLPCFPHLKVMFDATEVYKNTDANSDGLPDGYYLPKPHRVNNFGSGSEGELNAANNKIAASLVQTVNGKSYPKYQELNRPMTGPELRCEAWNAIAWGAKGLFWNPLIGDGADFNTILGTDLGHHYDWADDNRDCDDDVEILNYSSAHNEYKRDARARHLSRVWLGSVTPASTTPFYRDFLISEPMFDKWRIKKCTTGNCTLPEHFEYDWIERSSSSRLFNDDVDGVGGYTSADDITINSTTQKLSAWMNDLFEYNTSDASTLSSYTSLVSSLVDEYAQKAGLGTGWVPDFCTNCGTAIWQQRWKAAFHDVSTKCGDYYYGLWWPSVSGILDLNVRTNTYYGFKQKYESVKKFSNDITPLMHILPKLDWQFAVSTHHLRSEQENIDGISDAQKWSQRSPIKRESLVSVKFRSGVSQSSLYDAGSLEITYPEWTDGWDVEAPLDNDNPEMFYEIGLFEEPEAANASPSAISSPKYVVIVNRRMWPIYYEEDGSIKATHGDDETDEMLGPADSRRLRFKVNPEVFNGSFTHFTITNLRTGEEKLVTENDPYQIDLLEPGEGTLIKIAPAYSLMAGKTGETGMAYNNGHRIAEFGDGTETPPKRIMVWENNGNIEYRITNNEPEVGFENFINPQEGATSFTPITSQAGRKLQNPSVAASIDNVVVVYSTLDASNGRKVFAQWGKIDGDEVDWLDDIELDGNVPIDNDQPNQLITPVVTPGQTGFFIAWSNADNEGMCNHYIQTSYINLSEDAPHVIIEDANLAQSTIRKVQAECLGSFNAISEVFPTVASRDETGALNSSGSPTNKERFHLAWEVRWGPLDDYQSQIHYARFDRSLIDGSWQRPIVERASNLAPSCHHRYPNIAVQNQVNSGFTMPMAHGEPIIAWERRVSSLNRQEVMVRRRLGGGGWSSFTSLNPSNSDNLLLPMVKSGDRTILGVSPNYSLTYMDSIPKSVRIAEASSLIQRLEHYRLPDKGMYPNLATNYLTSITETLNTLTFRGTNRIYDNGTAYLYPAKVSAYPVESTYMPLSSVRTVTIDASKTQCSKSMKFTVQEPAIYCFGCPDSVNQRFGWTYFDIAESRQGYYEEPESTIYDWPTIEDSLRTDDFEYEQGDTIKFDRFFLIEDTSWVNEFITDSAKLTFSVLLKDSASSETIAVLDHIVIDTASTDIAVQRFNEGSITLLSPFPPFMPAPTTAYEPQGPGRHVAYVLDTLAPSGKAYITIKATKDLATELVLVQTHEEHDNFDVIIPVIGDSGAFKRAQPLAPSSAPRKRTIEMAIFPNPFNTSTTVQLSALKDAPLSVVVYDVLGKAVMTLHDGVAQKERFEFSINSSDLSAGSYFVRVANGNEVMTMKIEVVE